MKSKDKRKDYKVYVKIVDGSSAPSFCWEVQKEEDYVEYSPGKGLICAGSLPLRAGLSLEKAVERMAGHILDEYIPLLGETDQIIFLAGEPLKSQDTEKSIYWQWLECQGYPKYGVEQKGILKSLITKYCITIPQILKSQKSGKDQQCLSDKIFVEM